MEYYLASNETIATKKQLEAPLYYVLLFWTDQIADFVNESKKIHIDNEIRFDIRIGINTGPVVAGVGGSRKFSCDIWGDTLNIASRMKSNSKPGKINISANTYELIKDTFDCDWGRNGS